MSQSLAIAELATSADPLLPADASEASRGVAAEPQSSGGWELKELKQKHKDVAVLFAQGMKNVDIAKMCDITPEYVHMLLKQPLVRAYIQEMCEIVGVRMDALFAKSVDVIADTLQNGSEAGKLKAARLQLEATKKIGAGSQLSVVMPNVDRLEKLAERLIGLQQVARVGRTFNQDGLEVTDAT